MRYVHNNLLDSKFCGGATLMEQDLPASSLPLQLLVLPKAFFLKVLLGFNGFTVTLFASSMSLSQDMEMGDRNMINKKIHF